MRSSLLSKLRMTLRWCFREGHCVRFYPKYGCSLACICQQLNFDKVVLPVGITLTLGAMCMEVMSSATILNWPFTDVGTEPAVAWATPSREGVVSV